METTIRSVVARGQAGEERNSQKAEDFSGSVNTLYNIIMMDICYYTFVQICRRYSNNEP